MVVADGIGTFNAGRSIATTSGLTTDPVGSVFELGDAQISAWAEGDITVNAVVNPTLLPQPKVRRLAMRFTLRILPIQPSMLRARRAMSR
jgi:hypothetical protein